MQLRDRTIDFSKFADALGNGRDIIGVYYYTALLDRKYDETRYWKQQKFFSELKRIPKFHIMLSSMRKVKYRGGQIGFYVKGDDIQLVTDMLSFAYENKYESAILVSGDGDFVPAVKKVRMLGKGVENAYFLISSSRVLRDACDRGVLLGKTFIEKCLKR